MLGLRDLNRTLLARQHLLGRVAVPPLAVVEHLVGLQAQEPLPPYLSLAARIDRFDPRELSNALEERRAVRLLTMRGTIHLLTAGDALALRRWVQPAIDRVTGSNQMNKPARGIPGAFGGGGRASRALTGAASGQGTGGAARRGVPRT